MLSKKIIQEIEELPIRDGIAVVASLFPDKVVFSSSLGQEDQLLTDVIFKNNIPVRIFSIDTGRLFNETYELLDKTMARYKKPIQVYFPEACDVEEFVLSKGINSFYDSVENRKECCHVRKVKPLNRALADAKVWITGVRGAQSDNRKGMPMIEWDESRLLYKFNPLINWRYDDVMDYIKEFNVPYNSLHDNGFLSIGCAPCTRAVAAGEDARAGRWWWETSQKECGLHQTTVK